jgi:hypothetical protein
MDDNIVIPTKYKCDLTPFSQRLFQYDLVESKLFLTKASNYYLNSFTYGYDPDEKPFDGVTTALGAVVQHQYEDRKDCILDGFKTNITFLGSVVTVTCSPGTCIIDNTLISIFEPITITLDFLVAPYILNGYLLLTVSYKWNESIIENKPIFKLFMVNDDGTSYSPPNVNWTILLDRLVINRFIIHLSPSQADIISIDNQYPIPIYKVKKEFLLISNTIYEICPLINFIYESRKFILDRVAIKIVHVIDDISKWFPPVTLPPFQTTTPTEFSFAYIDISDINKVECITQCYVDNMKIEPVCIQQVSNILLHIWMPNWFVQTVPLKPITVIVIG